MSCATVVVSPRLVSDVARIQSNCVEMDGNAGFTSMLCHQLPGLELAVDPRRHPMAGNPTSSSLHRNSLAHDADQN